MLGIQPWATDCDVPTGGDTCVEKNRPDTNKQVIDSDGETEKPRLLRRGGGVIEIDPQE